MVKITKRGSKSWATFTVDIVGCEKLYIKGSWDEWKPKEMKRKRNGDFYITRVLSNGESYEFGYENESGEWIKDESVESIESPYGSLNSVIHL